MLLLLFALAQLICLSETCWHWNYARSEVARPTARLLIFDAGSTGTRLFFYQISKPTSDASASSMKVEQHNIKKTVALSSITNAAAFPELRSRLRVTLDRMKSRKDILEERFYKNTEVHLYATAGLRLVSTALSSKILEIVKSVFRASDFLFKSDESVRILSGQEEGVYLWLAVNFALNKSETVAVMDLGGGSTQIALSINQTGTAKQENEYNRKLLNYDTSLYAVSYLNAGRSAVRKLLSDKNEQGIYESVCVLPNKTLTETFSGQELQYTGTEMAEDKFEECRVRAKDVVSQLKIEKIFSVTNPLPTMYAVSSFYYTSKLLTNLQESYCDIKKCMASQLSGSGGFFTLKWAKNVSSIICNSPDPPKMVSLANQDFVCMDFSWLIALLQDGYGIYDENHPIHLQLAHSGINFDWATGIALQRAHEIFNNH
ncbi:Ectonucleoside triphosphate diphosphohydrolase 5 [Cichlidogyrus casuarinus]|uniref:Ectonucleoside triphosphate diphosphohydrolase 5 n=1 Tax=Cichlidogyrus casuarinus TaxID=1844966 RepID=A0ABD2PXJ7_9PLAT